MKLPLIPALIILLLTACQSDADKLVFSGEGSAFIQDGLLCIGGTDKSDVLSYYYLEELHRGGNKSLLGSGYHPVKITYPDTCFTVSLKSGVRYGILYIMNDIKYRFKFDVTANGTIAKVQRGS